MANARRPAIVTLFGVLNILLGLVGLVGAIMNGVMIFQLMASVPPATNTPDTATDPKAGLSAPPAPPPAPKDPVMPALKHPTDPDDFVGVERDQQKHLLLQVPGYDLLMIVTFVLDMVFVLMLLAAGIGMLRLRPAARKLVFVFFVLSGLFTIGWSYYNYAVLRPELQRWENNRNEILQKGFNETPPPPQIDYEIFAMIGAMVTCGAIYPLLQVLVLLLPSVRAAFRRPPAGATVMPG